MLRLFEKILMDSNGKYVWPEATAQDIKGYKFFHYFKNVIDCP